MALFTQLYRCNPSNGGSIMKQRTSIDRNSARSGRRVTFRLSRDPHPVDYTPLTKDGGVDRSWGAGPMDLALASRNAPT